MPNPKRIACALTMAVLGTQTPAYAANLDAGKAKAATCAGCHGADGNSGNAIWPSLAGQRPQYLKIQLKAFRNGSRQNEAMNSISESLGDDDIDNLAAYFSELPVKKPGGDPALATEGRVKYAACAGCHGPSGAGMGHIPRLAGQQPGYIEKQLKAFKDGTRKSPSMNAMAATLNEEEMAAIAAYLATLE